MTLTDKVKKACSNMRVQSAPWYALANGAGNFLGEWGNPENNVTLNEAFGQGCLNYCKAAPISILGYFWVLDQVWKAEKYDDGQKRRHAVMASLMWSTMWVTYHTYVGTYHPLAAVMVPALVGLVTAGNYRPKN